MEGRPPAFLDALRALRDALNAVGAPWGVIGGVAAIARGPPRFTVDIDATVAGAGLSIERMFEVFDRHAITGRIPSAITFARERHILLLRHDPSGVPLDVSLAWLPFEEEAIREAEAVDFAGVPLRVARPADLIIYKLVAGRPRDLDDVEGLLVLYGSTLDLERIRRIVAQFAEALDDSGRVENLERLLRRVDLA